MSRADAQSWTLNYKWKDSTLRWFSTLTTLGTQLDVALQSTLLSKSWSAHAPAVLLEMIPNGHVDVRRGADANVVEQAQN